MRRVLMLALLGLPLCAGAVNEDRVLWSRSFGGSNPDGGRWVGETNDGGILIVGYTYSFGAGDVDLYAVKADASGSEVWSRAFGGAGRDYGYGACETDDGGYLLVGYTTSFGAGDKDVYLVKTDSGGDELWAHTYGGASSDVGRAIVPTGDGSYVICGHTESAGAGEHDIYLLKVDSQGQQVWDMTYGGAESEWGMSLCETGDGGYVVTGPTGSSGSGNRDPYLLRTDSDGNQAWMRYYGTAPDFELGYDVCPAGDGGYVLIGHSDTHLSDLMKIDMYKTDAQGSQEWRRAFGEGTFYDYGKAVCPGSGGGFVVCGATKVPATAENDVYLIATDSGGGALWLSRIDEGGTEWASDVCQAQDGYLVCGHAKGASTGSFDVLLIKVSSLLPRFGALPTSGHAPLEVQFTDESLGDVTGWKWDLDGDGAVDSEQQNPTWTYDEPGSYTVSLEILDATTSRVLVEEDCIRVFDGESCIEFDGDASCATCFASPSLSISDALTVEAWISPWGWGEAGNSGSGRIVDKSSFALYLNGEEGAFSPHSIVLMLKNESGPPVLAWTPDSSVTLGRWQHVAATYDATIGHVRMYLDGIESALEQSGSPSGSIRDNADIDLVIGNGPGVNYTFEGVLDEVRVWSVVRSPVDILESMCQYLAGSEEGLAGYWSMNEGYGDTLFDATSYHNDAVVSAARWAQGVDLTSPWAAGGRDWASGTHPALVLDAVRPNPFAGTTTIEFDLPRPGRVSVGIYTVSGRAVTTLLEGRSRAGHHTLFWDGTDVAGLRVPPGPYVLRIDCGTEQAAEGCVLLR
jgi:PKD repeat protein